jgi:hypothetical protein
MDIDWPVLIGCLVLALIITFLSGGRSGSSTRTSRRSRSGRGRNQGFSGGGGRFSARRSFSGGGGRFSTRRSKAAAKRRR